MKTMLYPSVCDPSISTCTAKQIFLNFGTEIMDKTCRAIALFSHIVACRPVARQQLRDKQIYNSCC
jgi:hypothetical protein